MHLQSKFSGGLPVSRRPGRADNSTTHQNPMSKDGLGVWLSTSAAPRALQRLPQPPLAGPGTYNMPAHDAECRSAVGLNSPADAEMGRGGCSCWPAAWRPTCRSPCKRKVSRSKTLEAGFMFRQTWRRRMDTSSLSHGKCISQGIPHHFGHCRERLPRQLPFRTLT